MNYPIKWIIKYIRAQFNRIKFQSFPVPKIEDGNNFGVAVQEETLGEIQSVESEAAAFFDQISRYFISRAKIVSKVAKYPHISDYRRAVQVRNSPERLFSMNFIPKTIFIRIQLTHSIFTSFFTAGIGRKAVPQPLVGHV